MDFAKFLRIPFLQDISVRQIQSSRRVFRKMCSENMQQIYRRNPMSKSDFNKVACIFIEIILRHGSSSVNLLYIFRTSFPRTPLEGCIWCDCFWYLENLIFKLLIPNKFAPSINIVGKLYFMSKNVDFVPYNP